MTARARTAAGATGGGHGLRLRTTLRVAEPALAAATGRFWRHPRLRFLFADYLLCVLTAARAALGVMRAALARSEALAPGDPVAARLARYYSRHLAEEEGHAGWLVSDLETLGIPPERSLATIGPPSVAALVGAQYFWIEHVHPVAPLGYFAVLEGYPPSAAWIEEVRERTGLPDTAFRFLRAHGEIDPHHAADLFRLLDELPLTPEQASLVGLSALHTVGALGALFDDLSARAGVAE